jgi:ketosteroid isomerase-like protein
MKTTLAFVIALFAASWLLSGQTNKQDTAAAGGPPKTETALRELEQAWAEAVQRRDVDKIDRLQAEDYVFTDPGGRVWTKARALETIKTGDLEIDSFELSDFQVRLYGETAVVTMRIVWNGRFRGTDISGAQRMTDVFVKRDSRWQCVASQATRIAQP